MFKYLTLAAAVALTVSCVEKKEDSKNTIDISSEMIKSFQGKRSEVQDISVEDFPSEFYVSFGAFFVSDAYSEDGGEETEDEEQETCFGKMLVPHVATEGNVVTLTMEFVRDDACIAAEKAAVKDAVAEGDSASYSELTALSFSWVQECTNDMSAYNDLKDFSVDLEELCGTVLSSSKNMEISMAVSAWFKSNGNLTEIFGEQTSQEFYLNADGQRCQYSEVDGVRVEAAGCVRGYYSKSIIGDEIARSRYLLATRMGLSAKAGAPWYSSGSINFDIHNWSGALQYSGDSNAPTWSASNGNATLADRLDDAVLLIKPQNPLRGSFQAFGFRNQ